MLGLHQPDFSFQKAQRLSHKGIVSLSCERPIIILNELQRRIPSMQITIIADGSRGDVQPQAIASPGSANHVAIVPFSG
jgi:hypothetical protein